MTRRPKPLSRQAMSLRPRARLKNVRTAIATAAAVVAVVAKTARRRATKPRLKAKRVLKFRKVLKALLKPPKVQKRLKVLRAKPPLKAMTPVKARAAKRAVAAAVTVIVVSAVKTVRLKQRLMARSTRRPIWLRSRSKSCRLWKLSPLPWLHRPRSSLRLSQHLLPHRSLHLLWLHPSCCPSPTCNQLLKRPVCSG